MEHAGVASAQEWVNKNKVTQQKQNPKETDDNAAGKKTNSKGESHCFHCGADDYWATDCPDLDTAQQEQMHINVESEEDSIDGVGFLEVAKKKPSTLNPYYVYLDSCSMYNQVINDELVTNIR